MKHPINIDSRIMGLCQRIKALPRDYASLSDTDLVQMSAFFVTLKEGLCNFTDLYEEIQRKIDDMDWNPFCAIYAELVHRILPGSDSKNKDCLLHALYRQSISVPHESYVEYGEEDWICETVFNRIDHKVLNKSVVADYATLDLVLDTYYLFDGFEPEYKLYLETALAQWEAESTENDRECLSPTDMA